MSFTKKRIKKICNKYDYSFYDYFIDNMYTEHKYYIKNWYTGDFKGFNTLADIYYYFIELDEIKEMEKQDMQKEIY